MPDSRLVVIGNGMAGARTVEEILGRGGGDQFTITVFGDEPYGNYNRIQLSNVLAGSETPDAIYLNTVDWYRDNGIDLRAGVRVVRIDSYAKTVFADDGSIVGYDKLIIATGSRAFFPPIDGLWVDNKTLVSGVFGFRTLDDTAAMIEYADGHRHVAVVGGGLLGLEAARGLQNRGLRSTVVHSGPILMNAQLDETGGAVLRRAIENLGIEVLMGKRTTAIYSDAENAVTGIGFADGTAVDCDMLVLSTGIRPNVGLAQAAGLTVERANLHNLQDVTAAIPLKRLVAVTGVSGSGKSTFAREVLLANVATAVTQSSTKAGRDALAAG